MIIDFIVLTCGDTVKLEVVVRTLVWLEASAVCVELGEIPNVCPIVDMLPVEITLLVFRKVTLDAIVGCINEILD